MAWATTKVFQTVVGDRRLHVYDAVYSGTGYGGGQASTGATGATGPTRGDLGFADVTDPEFAVHVNTVPRGVTGAIYSRTATYDPYNYKLIVGATAGVDISDVTYRIFAYGSYQL